MSEFEYVMVLISLILGLGISQVLIGVAAMIKKSGSITFYFPHLICVAVVFGIHIQEWWVNYNYSRMDMPWHFSVFIFLIFYPIILFIMARLLFPIRMRGSSMNLREFYLRNYRVFFFFGFLMALVAIPQNIYLMNFSIETQLSQFLMSFLLIVPVLYKTRQNWFHYGISIIMAVFGLFYILLVNPSL